mmetsp:Transcript_9810/g.19073  ORF Transcript_9810/g.19073 Transcript_9810/m.19073 type:complete len:396 (+) Transcript_9810:121-1308(+)
MGDSIQILDRIEVKDARYCKKLMKEMGIKVDTEEVLLSNKGLLDYCPMGHLLCLEVLWLNDNRITKVHGLDTNVQIKGLYLHNNRINSLKGSLQHLKHVYTLSLYNNRLQDLEATLPLIQHLTHLEDLDLSGNPLANEVSYRLRVVAKFPSLKVLDKHEITEEERMEARMLFEGVKESRVAFYKTKPEWSNPPKQKIACLSIMTKDMYREIAKFKGIVEEEKRAKELAASQELSKSSRAGTLGGVSQTAPLATSVEMMTTRCLADVLQEDGLGDTTRRAGREKLHYGDHFRMKSFVRDTHPTVSVEATLAASRAASSHSRNVSRAPSAAGRAPSHVGFRMGSGSSSNAMSMNARVTPVLGSDIALDKERYAVYEQLRDRPQIKSELRDRNTWIKG